MKKEKPAHNRQIPISGYVTSSRLRRPNVSMVKMAGIANRKFVIPVPIVVSKALERLKPASMKICVL